jgi:GNAT superfamily N-acetyltransferase
MPPTLTLGRSPYALVAGELGALRWRAYVRDGKRSATSVPSDFVDAWDPRSEVVLARVDGALVGSVRVVPRVTVAEIGEVHGFDGPLPLKDDQALGEASRLCVDPEHRGRGLFWTLAAEMIFLAKDLGIRRLVGGSTEALLPNWRQCGFGYLGVSYPFASLNGSMHRLMVMDVDAVVSGCHSSSEFAHRLNAGSAV